MTHTLPVALLFDHDCRERALRLAEMSHVWIVDSEENRPTTESGRSATDGFARNAGQGSITAFTKRGTTPEDWALAVIDAIEGHHNERSSIGPYSALVVEGATLSAKVRQPLVDAGFHQFRETHFGFTATK